MSHKIKWGGENGEGGFKKLKNNGREQQEINWMQGRSMQNRITELKDRTREQQTREGTQ